MARSRDRFRSRASHEERHVIRILYESNHLIAVFKEPGISTQSDEKGGESLLESVREFIRVRDRKPGNVFVGLVHRLDRAVSGIVVFAKTSKGASRLSEQIREREVKKIYHAWVDGHPDPASARLVGQVAGKEAGLSYRTLKTHGALALLEVDLETGRKHQIRIQLSGIGHPIVGDKLYGSRFPFGGVISLQSHYMSFAAPVAPHETIEIRVPPDLQLETPRG